MKFIFCTKSMTLMSLACLLTPLVSYSWPNFQSATLNHSKRVIQVIGSGNQACALLESGSVKCWSLRKKEVDLAKQGAPEYREVFRNQWSQFILDPFPKLTHHSKKITKLARGIPGPICGIQEDHQVICDYFRESGCKFDECQEGDEGYRPPLIMEKKVMAKDLEVHEDSYCFINLDDSLTCNVPKEERKWPGHLTPKNLKVKAIVSMGGSVSRVISKDNRLVCWGETDDCKTVGPLPELQQIDSHFLVLKDGTIYPISNILYLYKIPIKEKVKSLTLYCHVNETNDVKCWDGEYPKGLKAKVVASVGGLNCIIDLNDKVACWELDNQKKLLPAMDYIPQEIRGKLK